MVNRFKRGESTNLLEPRNDISPNPCGGACIRRNSRVLPPLYYFGGIVWKQTHWGRYFIDRARSNWSTECFESNLTWSWIFAAFPDLFRAWLVCLTVSFTGPWKCLTSCSPRQILAPTMRDSDQGYSFTPQAWWEQLFYLPPMPSRFGGVTIYLPPTPFRFGG